jgi:hypothetical protein
MEGLRSRSDNESRSMLCSSGSGWAHEGQPLTRVSGTRRALQFDLKDTMLESVSRHKGKPCGWAACGNAADASLSSRPLCRLHFYEIGSRRLAECREHLLETLTAENDNVATLTFLSELITQTTSLVATARFLSALQRDQFLELSMLALDVSRRIQRHPRKPIEVLVVLYRSNDPTRRCESTRTINISKRGACVETRIPWEVSETLWIENAKSKQRALARVTWVKTGAASGTIGIEILDWEDFWNLS